MALLTFALAPMPARAQASCSSDGVAAPRAVLERFISADCESCWQDPQTARAGRGELALDWVVPGARGDDAPLATVASRDALERLDALRRKPPIANDALRRPVTGRAKLRAAHGLAFNDYIATSIASNTPGDAWLLLVEQLPAGIEGSPVERHLVRNAFRVEQGRGRIDEVRSMQIHAGAKPERLRVVALLHDAKGRLAGAAITKCR